MDYRKFGIFHSIFLQEESSTFLMQYKTRNKAILIENLELQITIVTNVDELMDHLLAKGEDHQDVKDERIPYWADLGLLQ